ncbi:hypothetical protein EDB84DRAFT_1555336 [Lactarius hengduanensis]|nr:hypothetical protein EDB84DRAFT_1555336 [Lactarius hengduanensis]
MVSSGDVQRLFLQSVISRRVLSVDLAKALWKQSVEAVKAADDTTQINANTNSADGWSDFLAALNKSLDPLDLELSRTRDEMTGKDMYALVNRRDDEIARIASDYSPLEISYFRALVEQIMLAPNNSYSISPLQPSASFVAKGWLLKSKKGRFSLSPRSLLELQPYLKSTYPDEILECTICFEILTRGHACPKAKCGVGMHNACYDTYRRSVGGKGKCPKCSEDWGRAGNDKVVPIGEAAAPKDEWPRRTRRSLTESEDGGDDVDVPMADQAESSQMPARRTRQRATSVSTPHSAVDDEEGEEPPQPKRREKGRRRG